MATGVISWSTTAASNATADSTINWAEGQAPSSVNDSARATMAAVAKWREDITSILVTGGTGTAYTITSNQVIAANINGMTVQFTPGTTNTGAVTLSVDGQTARALQIFPGTDLPAGTLVSGSLYQATYRAAVTTWLLHSFDCRQWIVPLGSALPYFGATAPSSAFLLPYGQAISRTTYATLFTLFSTTYGAGNGSTTFNVPDLRGRVLAGKDDMGGSAASRLTSTYYGVSAATLGAASTGGQSTTIATANLPAYTPSGSISAAVVKFSSLNISGAGGTDVLTPTGTSTSLLQQTFTGTAEGGIQTPFSNIQPTLIGNYILRVI